jgi:predicted small secreted protein
MRIRAITILLLLAPVPVLAAGNAAEGGKLVEAKKCETCHANKTMGDASAVYLRKDRKVTSMARLQAQVTACNTQLNLGLFPEDEEHITAFLNERYYRFGSGK